MTDLGTGEVGQWFLEANLWELKFERKIRSRFPWKLLRGGRRRPGLFSFLHLQCKRSEPNSNVCVGTGGCVGGRKGLFPNTSKQSIQLWHCLPGGGIRSHRVIVQSYKTAPTPPIQTHVASPGCHPASGYRLEFPGTSSLGSINLLERITEVKRFTY